MLQKLLISFRTHIFVFVLLLALMILIGTRPRIDRALAQEPESDSPQLSLQIAPVNRVSSPGLMNAAEASPVPVFNVGDIFRVSIIALDVAEPGIFGAQFELNYDPEFLKAVDDSLIPGSALAPVVNPVNHIDLESGLVTFAASRQGDLANVAGDVVLDLILMSANFGQNATDNPWVCQ